jgi:hypothetical protein
MWNFGSNIWDSKCQTAHMKIAPLATVQILCSFDTELNLVLTVHHGQKNFLSQTARIVNFDHAKHTKV